VPNSRAKAMIKLASRFMGRTFRLMPQRVEVRSHRHSSAQLQTNNTR
jgi:hypothetical protein